MRIISEYLNKVWSGQTIISLIWDEHSKFNKIKIKGLNLLNFPCKIIGIFSRGKCIIIECVNSKKETIYLVSQLGMEGKWIHNKDAYSNLSIHFENDKKETDVWYYSDSRHFGNFNVFSDLKELCKKHGPCYLTTLLINKDLIKKERFYQEIVTLSGFAARIKNKRIQNKEICDFLMEQKYFSGIGNYLKSEILYRAKINPHRFLSKLSNDDIQVLFNCIMEQLWLSYTHKGLTIKSYWSPEGEKGVCPLQVYKKKTDPFGNSVETFQDKNNRKVHWVPNVQI